MAFFGSDSEPEPAKWFGSGRICIFNTGHQFALSRYFKCKPPKCGPGSNTFFFKNQKKLQFSGSGCVRIRKILPDPNPSRGRYLARSEIGTWIREPGTGTDQRSVQKTVPRKAIERKTIRTPRLPLGSSVKVF